MCVLQTFLKAFGLFFLLEKCDYRKVTKDRFDVHVYGVNLTYLCYRVLLVTHLQEADMLSITLFLCCMSHDMRLLTITHNYGKVVTDIIWINPNYALDKRGSFSG